MDSAVQDLIHRFNTGLASEADKNEIERLLFEGAIDLEDLKSLSGIEERVMAIESPGPSKSLDSRFYSMLDAEVSAGRRHWKIFPSWPGLLPKLSLAAVMLIMGLAAGYFIRPGSSDDSNQQITALSQQVSELQEMMMLSLLEKGTATERLKAVGLTGAMNDASRKVTAALIRTLNGDENVNVRLAALEALKPYASDSSVREALIRSIGMQESPLVQISLAELMVALQEKAAVKEFEKLVESGNTPAEVKNKLKESIKTLI